VDPIADPAASESLAGHARVTRATWHAVGLILAALFAYAAWRGYQNPDLLLELSALRLC
jgi:HAMP domain-containing protein